MHELLVNRYGYHLEVKYASSYCVCKVKSSHIAIIICLICLHSLSSTDVPTYVSGKELLSVLQLLHNYTRMIKKFKIQKVSRD